jgi:isopropylmalate/homocitrate/citramalate synthase
MRTVLLDTTLREGELYRPLKLPAKIAIAKALLEVGLKRVELTLAYPPRTSPEDLRKVLSVVNEHGAETVIHCRACREDVENASRYDSWGIAVYMALSRIHVKHKFGKDSHEEITRKLIEAIELSREMGFKYVRATVEDASRIYLEESIGKLIEIINILKDAGATMISIPDTSGLLTPSISREFFKELKKHTQAPLSAHFHNDYGYASANTVEAILAGADEAHVSILGLGDRNGIADLYEVTAALTDIHKLELGIKREYLRSLYEVFSKLTGIKIPARHPLSDEARTIRAGVHQAMTTKAPEGYIPRMKLRYDFDSPLYEVTPFISKKLIERILNGYSLDSEKIKELTEYIGAEASRQGGRLSIERLHQIFSENGLSIPYERLGQYFGYMRAYVLLKVKNGQPINSLIEELASWKEIELIQEVSGDSDLLLMVKMNPEVEENIQKIKKVLGNSIERINLLIIH